MATEQIKISQLPELSSLDGFFTVGSKTVGGTPVSYKVNLGFVGQAAAAATASASAATAAASEATSKAALADTAATNATTKAGLADTAATNANTAAARVESAIETAEADHTQAVADHTASVAATTAANEAAEAAEEAVETMEGTYAKKDGYYESMTVGRAENLVDVKGEGTPHEFVRRTSCGNDSIEDDGTATIKRIKGNTIVWNQKTTNGDTPSIEGGWIQNNGTLNNGSFTASASLGYAGSSTFYIITGHKYYTSGLIKTSAAAGQIAVYASTSSVGYGYNVSSSAFQRVSKIFSAISNSQVRVYVRDYRPSGWDAIEIKSVMCIDLTQMFGAGNEPSTVEEFEALFPASYYPYNEGQLLSLKADGIVTDGFNQWDEGWELGYFDPNNGQERADSSRLRSKNYIQVFPNTTYFGLGNIRILFYDTDKHFISSPHGFETNAMFTTPDNCRYIRFNFDPAYGTTYNHDICINLSWSGYRNGEYEPYWKNTKALPIASKFTPANYSAQSTYAVGDLCLYDGKMYKCSTAITTAEAWNSAHWTLIRAAGIGEMLSAGSVHDEMTDDGMVIRVGAVDLGSLSWIYRSNNNLFTALFVNAKNAIQSKGGGATCSKYSDAYFASFVGWTNFPDKAIAAGTNYIDFQQSNSTIVVKDTTYTDAASLKAAMSGVMLYYELAEPIVIPFGEKLNLSYKVADFGTETVTPEGVDEQGVPKTAPFRADIKYSDDFTRRIVNLPKNYQSQESMDAMLTALGAALGFTFTKTWDATNGKWTYTITKTS